MPLSYIYKSSMDDPQKVYAYASITQSGYGRIDDTPSKFVGLYVSGLLGVAIIGHCVELKRTVLINTQHYVGVKQTLQPIFDWVVAKNEEKYSEHNSIEVAVLRGYLYRDPNPYATRYESFMKDVNDFFKDAYEKHSKHIDDDQPTLSSSEATVFVDKGTASVTILAEKMEPLPPRTYSEHQVVREIFSNDFLPSLNERENGKIVKERHLQFDINRFTRHSRISDNCRLLLRAKYSFNRTRPGIHLLSDDLDLQITAEQCDYLYGVLDEMTSVKLPCEVCPVEGSKECFRCRGAWYCSGDHYREDFNEHKRFCDLHPVHSNTFYELKQTGHSPGRRGYVMPL